MSNNKDFKVKNGVKPTVYHEAVGTVVSGGVGYSLGSASYDGVSLSVTSQEATPFGLFIKPDGTKLYVVGISGDDINEYNLSTAWDISSGTFLQSFSVAGQEIEPTDVFFKPDGLKMYVVGLTGREVNEYNLSVAWNVSTASFVQLFSLSAQDTSPLSLHFKPDGTKMFIMGGSTDRVLEYSLSSAWNVSTASYTQGFSISSVDNSPYGLDFKPDGTEFYYTGTIGDSAYKFTMSTAWDVSTATYSGENLYLLNQDTQTYGIQFKDDGTKLYALGGGSDTIYQYSTVLTTKALDLSTGSVFEITPTSDIQVTLSNPADSGTVSGATLLLDGGGSAGYDLSNGAYSAVSFDVSSQEANPSGITFNANGTKLYLSGSTGDSIYQYSLSSAYDLTTMSYDSVSFSVASQETQPNSLAFNNDGTKMYVVGQITDAVYQYSLSTGFDLSTASYDSVSFSVASQETQPTGIAFNSNGTKMYIVGYNTDAVYQYSLSTAFNLSTASYDSVSLSVASQNGEMRDITFSGDGTKLFLVGESGSDAVYQYSLSTAFDLSTASYDSVSLSVTDQDTQPKGLVFNDTGKTLFVVGATTDTVYQYNTATPATITYDTAIEWPGGTAPTSPAIGDTDVITFSTRDGGTTYNAALAIDGAA